MLDTIKSSAFVRSFREKWLFWGYLAVTVVTLWCVLVFTPTSELCEVEDWHLRGWGMALQLFGAWTVWHDLTSTASEYGDGPSWRKTRDYIKSVFFKPAQVTSAINIPEGADIVSMNLDNSEPLDPRQMIEIRVAQLELFAQKLNSELTSLKVAMTQQKSELTADLKRSMDELRRESGRVEGQMKQALVGNLYVLTFGVFCLVLGIVLTSIPAEIVDWSFRLNL